MKTTVIVLLTSIAVLISLMANDYSSTVALYWHIFIIVVILLKAYSFPFFRGSINAALDFRGALIILLDLGLLINSINYLGRYFVKMDISYLWAIKIFVGAIYALGLAISYKRSRPITAV